MIWAMEFAENTGWELRGQVSDVEAAVCVDAVQFVKFACESFVVGQQFVQVALLAITRNLNSVDKVGAKSAAPPDDAAIIG